MGYRTYIGKISKEEYEEIKNMPHRELYKKFGKRYEEEWEDDDLCVSPYEIVQEVYEFGKYTDFDDNKFFKPFFTNKKQQEEYGYDFWVVDKDYLEHIINHYRKRIEDYYEKMVTPFWGKEMEINKSGLVKTMKRNIEVVDGDVKETFTFDFSQITPEEQTALWETLCHVRTMRSEWVLLNPYDLEKGDEVTRSWKFEYNIFELVRIYKTFDWENDLLVYYGY